MGEVVRTHFPVFINFVIFPDKLVQAIYFDTACFVEKKTLLKALKTASESTFKCRRSPSLNQLTVIHDLLSGAGADQ